MDFEFEDLDIEIAVGGEGGEDVSEAAGDADTASTELENVICTFEKGIKRLDNLSAAADHFTKFGVTKQALHLYNKGNKLGKAIGVALPTYESDEEVAAGDADVEIEITVEAIGEVYDKTKQWIIDFFKRIYQAIKDFFSKYFGLATRLEKRLNKIKSDLINKNIDRDKFAKIKMSVYSFKDYGKLFAAMEKAGETIGKSIDGLTSSGVIDINPDLKKAMAELGFEIDVEMEDKRVESIKFDKNDTYTKEDDELGKLDWSWAAVEKLHSNMKIGIKVLRELPKIERNFQKVEKEFLAKMKTHNKPGDTDKDLQRRDRYIANVSKYISCYMRCMKEITGVTGRLITMYCSIAEKATIKK